MACLGLGLGIPFLPTHGGGFNPASMFANGEQGVWYDPGDMSTLFQDSAGTTPVTAVEQPVGRILDKSGRGNHAIQATAAARPVLSARKNLLLATTTLATQSVTATGTAPLTLSFTGTGTVTLSGASTAGPLVGTGASNRVSLTFSPASAASITYTVTGSVTDAQLEIGSVATRYQRVTTATDYDTAGFPLYLKFDGVDDGMVSVGNVDFSATDKVTVFAGVTKLSDVAVGCVAELNATIVNGVFGLLAPNGAAASGYGFRSRGTVDSFVATPTTFPSPNSAVATLIADIAADVNIGRINGTQQATGAGDQGAGNYISAPLYIGRRGGTSNPLNGNLYELIIRGAASSAAEVAATESYLAGKSGVTLP
jgi:hypothetical protein